MYQNIKNSLLKRLFPPRLSPRKSLKPEHRLRLFGAVSDNDPCLKAIYDLLDDVIEAQAGVAFNPDNDDRAQQIGWLHVGFCCQLMRTIEDERVRGERLNQGIKE
jgi:hypothetical protein